MPETAVPLTMQRRERSGGMKLLVIEDEKDLGGAICRGLTKKGYAVDYVQDGREGLELLYVNEYDLVVLDLNLPGMDGIDLLREVRREDKELKVLILSARGSVHERILGLDSGANDYLVKPFHFEELDARIRSLLRRNFVQKDIILKVGEVTLDQSARRAFRDGFRLELTKTEFAILEYLMLHRGETISTETLLEHIYGGDVDLFSNSIKVHIHSLRKKLGEGVITNIRGQGYLIAGEELS